MSAGDDRHASAERELERQFFFWRWKWRFLLPAILAIAACMTVALRDDVAALLLPQSFEARAVIEVQGSSALDDDGGSPAPNAIELVAGIRQRMLTRESIRSLVESHRVDFGWEADSESQQHVDLVRGSLAKRLQVKPLGSRHIAVSMTGSDPARNAAIVNGLVKMYLTQEGHLALVVAKSAVAVYRQELDAAEAGLNEVDNQLRDFAQNNPWLHDAISELHRDLKDAETEEEAIQQEIAELEALLEDLKKALAKEDPEIIVAHDVEPPAEIKVLRQRAEAAEAYFRSVDASFRPTHSRWQDARRRYEQVAAELKEKDQGDLTEERTVDNPKYVELQQKAFAVEKSLEKLRRRNLDANKKVSEFYLLYRKAPELLAEKKRLNQARASAKEIHDKAEGLYRAADRQVQNAMRADSRGRLRVMEFARAEFNGADQESRIEEIEELQARALACGLGVVAGVCPVLLAMVMARALAHRFYAAMQEPHRGSCAGCGVIALICVLVPVAAAAGIVWVASRRSGDDFGRIPPSVEVPRPASPSRTTGESGPLTVASFQTGEIIYSQLDRNEFVTSISHFFRELGPDDDNPNKPFTINRSEADTGQIELYRLRNVGTGEVFEFQNVPVKRLASGDWIITDDGQKQIRDQLQARMRVQLRRIGGS